MRLALLGVGLIGGSFARAARATGKTSHVVGFDTEPAALQRALELGVIDAQASTAAQAVIGADVVMIATPVGAIRQMLREIAPQLSDAAVVTDVGSSKAYVIEAAREELGSHFPRFVPGHPIAGSERSGVEHSQVTLFSGKIFVSTPLKETDTKTIERVESWWRDFGCRVERMTPTRHDQVFAAVSHLPHVVAFAMVAHVAGQPDAEQKFVLAGASFHDFTRIAASDALMWSDICASNNVAIGGELRALRSRLDELQRAIDIGDRETLRRAFAQAAAACPNNGRAVIERN